MKARLRQIFSVSVSVAALSLLLASCGSAAGTSGTSAAPEAPAASRETFAAVPGAAAADQPAHVSPDAGNAAAPRDTVTVSASATASLVPDRAQFSVGVTTEAKTAEKAQEDNTTDVNSIIDVLKGAGVEEKSIRTGSYNLSPRYDYSGDTQKIDGYTAYCILTVDDRPVDSVGSLITKCVSAGATDVRDIRYYCSGYDAAYAGALEQALASAHTKAQALAEAAGRELGGAVTISEIPEDSSARWNSSAAYSAKTEAAAADLSVMPGETDITAQVSVSYALK